MKNFLFILFTLFSLTKVDAQAVLEHHYDSVSILDGYYTSMHGYIYSMINFEHNVIDLYDSQHTLLKSITLPGSLYNVINVSDKLFNDDDKLEVLVTANLNQNYVSTVIVNEDNLILQTFEHEECPIYFAIFEINGEFKMKTIGYPNYYIYSLPGTTILDIPEDALHNQTSIFPNPAKKEINIQYSEKATEIAIYSITGSEIYRKRVTAAGSEKINVSAFPCGNYIYKVLSDRTVISTGKFQVIR